MWFLLESFLLAMCAFPEYVMIRPAISSFGQAQSGKNKHASSQVQSPRADISAAAIAARRRPAYDSDTKLVGWADGLTLLEFLVSAARLTSVLAFHPKPAQASKSSKLAGERMIRTLARPHVFRSTYLTNDEVYKEYLFVRNFIWKTSQNFFINSFEITVVVTDL